MKRSTIIIVIAVVLAVSVIVFTFFGCSCFRKPMAPPTLSDMPKVVEGFESSSKDKPLTPQETELFEDLMNNRLNEDDIKTLVQNNILNQQLVEKFLDKLSASDAADVDKMNKPEMKDEEVVEGFTSVGNTFACAAFGPGQ